MTARKKFTWAPKSPSVFKAAMRFVLDGHLGKLARHLRMMGFDALWREDYSDEEILRIQAAERRVVLSRDRALLKDPRLGEGYWVQASGPKEQAREVLSRFDLFSRIDPFTVCLECNGKIAAVKKEEILDRIEDETREVFDEFFICRDCRKIYWKGSHYDRMMEFIRELQKNRRADSFSTEH